MIYIVTIIMCRSTVGSGKLHEMKDNLDYIVAVLLRYPNNEDIAAAALGLIEAIYSLGMLLCEVCYSSDLPPFCDLELSILSEHGSSHEHTKGDLKFSDVLQLASQSLDRFTELQDVQCFGFNCLSYIFTLSKVDVSQTLNEADNSEDACMAVCRQG